jgi:hypothetical protein
MSWLCNSKVQLYQPRTPILKNLTYCLVIICNGCNNNGGFVQLHGRVQAASQWALSL